MSAARSVVITGASRGLGLASAIHLYQKGWHVIGAMRTPDAGLEKLRAATGAQPDDPRLTGVRLDLSDAASIEEAATQIEKLADGPLSVVHNAGIVTVGCVEEVPFSIVDDIFTTNVFGAIRLTAALLPSMRAAGSGRIVIISSEGAIHGMPGLSAYSASKGALERWAESLALEVAPFGLGVSILVAGTFKTDILDRDFTVSYGDPDGPYGDLHAGSAKLEDTVLKFASPPEKFAPALAKVLDDRAPFTRRAIGPDAVAMRISRAILPAGVFQRMVSKVLGIPRFGALRTDPIRLERPDISRSSAPKT